MHPTEENTLREHFGRLFPDAGERLWWSSASGRINLIGEHTDYSEGLALPAATNRRIQGVFEALETDEVTVHSRQFEAPASFRLAAIPDLGLDHWGRFVASSARVLQRYAAE